MKSVHTNKYCHVPQQLLQMSSGQKCGYLWPGRPQPDTPNTVCSSITSFRETDIQHAARSNITSFRQTSSMQPSLNHPTTHLSLMSVVSDFWKLMKHNNNTLWYTVFSKWMYCTSEWHHWTAPSSYGRVPVSTMPALLYKTCMQIHKISKEMAQKKFKEG